MSNIGEVIAISKKLATPKSPPKNRVIPRLGEIVYVHPLFGRNVFSQQIASWSRQTPDLKDQATRKFSTHVEKRPGNGWTYATGFSTTVFLCWSGLFGARSFVFCGSVTGFIAISNKAGNAEELMTHLVKCGATYAHIFVRVC